MDVNKAALGNAEMEVEGKAAKGQVPGSGLVPMGSVDALLETYDGDRKLLPVREYTHTRARARRHTQTHSITHMNSHTQSHTHTHTQIHSRTHMHISELC